MSRVMRNIRSETPVYFQKAFRLISAHGRRRFGILETIEGGTLEVFFFNLLHILGGGREPRTTFEGVGDASTSRGW